MTNEELSRLIQNERIKELEAENEAYRRSNLLLADEGFRERVANAEERLAEQAQVFQQREVRLREALVAAKEELRRWGWGDFHYGDQPQDQSVVDAVAAIDGVLSETTAG